MLTCLDDQPATTYLMVSVGATSTGAQWVHDLDDPAVIAAHKHLDRLFGRIRQPIGSNRPSGRCCRAAPDSCERQSPSWLADEGRRAAPAPAELRRALALAEELGALHQTMTSLHLPDHLSGPSRESMFRGAVWWLRRLLEQ